MRISTGQMFHSALNALLDQQTRMLQTQQQVATGKRILAPSDDPAGAARLLGLGQSLQQTEQYQENISATRGQLQQTETTLGSVNNVLDRVRELSIQANNASVSAADRRMIAVEMQQSLDELLSLANTRNGNGEYMFAGYQGQTEPFSTDAVQGFVYHGDDGQRFAQVGANRQIAVGYPGSEVFQRIPRGNGDFVTEEDAANTGSGVISVGSVTDPTAWDRDTYTISFPDADNYIVEDSAGNVVAGGAYSSGAQIAFNGVSVSIEGSPQAGDSFTVAPGGLQGLFTTVDEMITVLEDDPGTGTPTTLANATNRFLADIDQAMENIRSLRAQTGARLSALDAQENSNADTILRTQEAQSELADLDYASAISDLSRQLVGYEAAQRSFLRIQGLSLFNFL